MHPQHNKQFNFVNSKNKNLSVPLNLLQEMHKPR